MYLVLLHHPVQTGPAGSIAASPLLLTHEGVKALDMAREAEKMGHDLTEGSSITIGIYCPEHPYRKGQAPGNRLNSDLGIVFTRTLKGGAWEETWSADTRTKKIMEGIVERDEAA